MTDSPYANALADNGDLPAVRFRITLDRQERKLDLLVATRDIRG